ncbi:MAG: hypothetical protein V1891_05320 [bacterium]
MHDLHLANQIVNLARAYAQKQEIKIIKNIKINLGVISEHNKIISPANLEFNIKLLLGNNVKVEIEEMAGDMWELVEIGGDS